jgi:methionine biosynthesis protein MetW
MGSYDRGPPNLDDAGNAWALVARSIRRGERVLDLGCYDGLLLATLRDRLGIAPFGVERDAEAAAKAKARGLDVVIGNLDDASWVEALGGRRFDAVIAADVIEHLVDPKALLETVRERVLAPGGRLVASIPNVAHGTVRLQLLLGDLDPTDRGILDRTHLHFFTRRTIHALLRDAGFRVESIGEVRSDVPAEVTRTLLARAGLADPALERWIATAPDATTFQFVVDARPAEPGAIPPPPTATAPDVHALVSRVLKGQAAKIRRLEERIAVLEKRFPFGLLRYAKLLRRQARERQTEAAATTNAVTAPRGKNSNQAGRVG